ncbi:MAG: isoprenylcysteine carboxylmethyltransferase family protein [Pseudomonadota bacterium]
MTRRSQEISLALLYGALCHGLFGLAGLLMLWGLYTGMTGTFGRLDWPLAGFVNALLLIQFPLGHSWLLSPRGQRLLAALAPPAHGKTLATTTYAAIASLQLLLLFGLWTPSHVILWQAEGAMLWLMTALFAASWAYLAKASFDAGPELQSGALGWMALLRGRRPVFPDMPERGLFRITRQPIYLGFAMTLWTMPIWTLDQLTLAILYTGYCVFGPRLKERRFLKLYGDRFSAYRARVPYWLPRLRRRVDAG